MGQTAYRPDFEILDRISVLLRYVYLRRPDDVYQTVNALSHYTDWTVAHVHAGALGWVGFVTIGSVYYMIPRLFGKNEMYSTKLVEAHFWIATIGVVLYYRLHVDCRCIARSDVGFSDA